MSYLIGVGIFFVSLLASASGESDAEPDSLTYIVYIGQTKPLQMLDTQDQPVGIISDLIFAMVHGGVESLPALENKLIVKRFPFKRALHELKTGRQTNWISYGARAWSSPQGENIVDCKLMDVRHSLLSLAGTRSIKSLKDLQGETILLFHGFHFPTLQPAIDRGELNDLRIKTYRSALNGVDAKRGFGFVEMDLRIRYNLADSGRQLSHYTVADFSHTIPEYSIYLSLDPAMSKRLKASLTSRCQYLIDKGFIEQRIDHYLQQVNSKPH